MPKIAIIYASRTGKTRKMAEAIASGAKSVEGSEVVLKDATKAAPSDVLDAGAVILGGATYNSELIKTMNPFLDAMEGVDLKGKVGAAFGSYGWSGEAPRQIQEMLTEFKVDLLAEPVQTRHVPDPSVLARCYDLGRTIAEKICQKVNP